MATSLTLDEVIAQESKDALLEWALNTHGHRLNGAYRFETLVEKARELDSASPGLGRTRMDEPDERPEAERWLLNPKTGHKFPWTKMLADRGDLVPCDPPPPPDEAAPT
jgi:hypothetical protein